jgi:hypothetical protein
LPVSGSVTQADSGRMAAIRPSDIIWFLFMIWSPFLNLFSLTAYKMNRS